MDKNLEKKIIEMNILNNQVQEMEQQGAMVEKKIAELQTVAVSLNAIKGAKSDSETFSSIGEDIFVKAKISDNSRVLVSLGGKAFAEKKIEDAEKMLEDKIEQLKDIFEKLNRNRNTIIQRMLEIQSDLEKIKK
ncbi:MAG: prefoldin subunit alpha [archaeon]